MKKLILAIFITASLASCNDFGKKVKIDGTNTEVYYKGDGVTESDAKKTGDFLKKEMISDDKKASIQITKDGEAYTIRFVYDKKVYDTLTGGEKLFQMLAAKASKEVFNGKKVNIGLANDQFKDYKTIPYDESVAKMLDAPVETPTTETTSSNNGGPSLNQSDYDHDTMGGVKFFWRGITDQESKTIADYIVKNGAFAGGTAEIYMTKEDGRYVLRFPMIASARTDATYIAEVDKVSKEIKDNVFANDPYSFIVTDEQLTTVKKWDY